MLVFQSLSHVQLFVTQWIAVHQASLSFTISQSLLKLMSIGPWCLPTISSSVAPFSSCLQSFPASGSFLRSQFFISGGHSMGAAASASVLPVNAQGWFPLGWTGWTSLQSKDFLRKNSTMLFACLHFSLKRVRTIPFLQNVNFYRIFLQIGAGENT